MIHRELEPPSRSFFLFGPRQTGKSTWLQSLELGQAWFLNLLENDTYFRLLRDPGLFGREARTKADDGVDWVILDEVQRIPALLDEVHGLMESTALKFILSGSSARKLKRGSANLLGGRALFRRMHPFTVREMEARFDLERTLRFGSLPPLVDLDERDAIDTLRSYVEIYLREEIKAEGLVRNLGGFARLLDLAAAYTGEILNYSSIAKEAALPVKTVQSYFEILEDTMIGFRLDAWTKSPLKRLVAHPKFYLFDNGVTNALAHRLAEPLNPVPRGRLFEQFLLQETKRILDYRGVDARLFFWRTNNGAEVDLLVELNGGLALAVEFKSRTAVSGSDLSGLRAFRDERPDVPCLIACTAPEPFRLDFAEVLPWRRYLDRFAELA
jgi:predicted AAA+ superfamily ATPase